MNQTWRTTKPSPDEYAPYYRSYVDQVPARDLLEELADQLAEMTALLHSIPESRGNHRYAEGKWSVKEVIGHLMDSERVFGLRALWFARGETTELPGFDENAWAPQGAFDSRALSDLRGEFCAVRLGTTSLFSSLNDDMAARSGVANGKRVTVRALAWIIAGHTRHHLKVLKERYL